MAKNYIEASGCREGNLKGVSVKIPYEKLVAITGVSGSGKSSFAFDTLYAEGRRQMLEALDAGGGNYYISKNCAPSADVILGLPPTIAIKQNRHIRTSTSTMGSISHINSFLFSLFSVAGEVECKKCRQKNLHFQKTCPKCGTPIPSYPPSFFSNQSPYGACQSCGGSGEDFGVDETLLYPNQTLSIDNGGLLYGTPTKGTTKHQFLDNYLKQFGASLQISIENFPIEAKRALLYGTKKSKKLKLEYPGLVPEILRLYKESQSDTIREQLGRFLELNPCEDCGGMGISLDAQNVFIKNRNICDVQRMTILELHNFIEKMLFCDYRDDLCALYKKEILESCDTLIKLGVGYLTLVRRTASLSGGEMHRITMTTFLASQLSGILYILDEPSTGLHWQEIPNLLSIINQLRKTGNGNTIVFVEHNRQLIQEADYIVEFGPGPSRKGGEVVFQGFSKDLSKCRESVTGQLLEGSIPLVRTKHIKYKQDDCLGIRNACSNNLQHIDVDLPLHCLVAVTGVSGSGKSSLLFDTFFLDAKTKSSKTRSRVSAQLIGRDRINQIITCEQAPIAKSKRSIVVTYIDVFSSIREKFCRTQSAKRNAMGSGLFSFNTKGGACPCCNGYGYISTNIMSDDNQILCPTCLGKRYRDEILQIKYKDKNISDILEMDIGEALVFFDDDKCLSSKFQILKEVGLDYLRLGQRTTELSGGESQRLKLSVNLMDGKQKNSLYIFDEPSAGLHPLDLQRILDFFDKLLKEGNSVAIVEHNIELIALADYVIDLGPGAGSEGGKIIAKGTPCEVAKSNKSVTGKTLRHFLL